MTKKNRLAAPLAAAALVVTLLPAASLGAADTADVVWAVLRGVPVDDLRIVPIEGIVIVRGKVRNRAAFETAQRRLARLPNAPVANMLRIVPLPTDDRITSEAERSLALARALRGAELRVRTDHGIVTLYGTVENEIQRDTAAEIIGRIEGVRSVRVVVSVA
ncbi:MAG: BON domain-containing protein [Thermoanaerobaculia bacterium]